MVEYFLGRPIMWWAKIAHVLELYGITDSDQLAFMLRSRGEKPVKNDEQGE